MYHFIMNAAASSGQVLKTWKIVNQIIGDKNIPYILHAPKSREESIQIVNELSSGKEQNHLIVIGGDGTLNTVMQGIKDFNSLSLSLIPAGSGNDFAKGVGISSNPEKALLRILDSPSKRDIDYGELKCMSPSGEYETKRFLISCGTGYDADICEEVNRSSAKSILNKLHLGKIVYLYVALKKLFAFKKYISGHNCDATLVLDDKKEVPVDNMFLTVAMNTPYQGGGAPFCPMADWTDGYFDICCVDNMTTPKLLACIMMVYVKKHFLFKEVTHHHCKKLELSTTNPRWMHTDGETDYETSSIIMECKHGLKFIY